MPMRNHVYRLLVLLLLTTVSGAVHSMPPREAYMRQRAEIISKLEEGGPARQQAIWYIYQTGHHDLLPRAVKFLAESDDFDDHRAVLRTMHAYGRSLESYLPDWYNQLDRYMSRNIPEDILIQAIELSRDFREFRMVFALSRLANHPRTKVRHAAYEAMASIGSDNVIPLLLKQIASKRPIHQVYGLEGAGLYKDKRLEPFIRGRLDERNKSVRIFALLAIAQQKGAETDPAVVVAKQYTEDGNPEVRARAVEIIGKKKWARQNYIVRKAVRDSSPVVRRAAIQAAVELIDRSSASEMSAQMRSEKYDDIKIQLIDGLVRLRGKDSSNGLGHLIRDPSKEVRQAAAMGIGNLKDRDQMHRLYTALKTDEEIEVRLEAASALGKFKDADMARKLIPLISSVEAPLEFKSILIVSILKMGNATTAALLNREARNTNDTMLKLEIKRLVKQSRKN